MCLSLGHHEATESRGVEWCFGSLPLFRHYQSRLFSRISSVHRLSHSSKILEIGCAQGQLMVALREKGYSSVVGVESSVQAIKTSQKISKALGVKLDILSGRAEKLPFADSSFDLVIANSVLEHVQNPDLVFREVKRVLKRGGAFYISTTSVLCPHQSEIRYFPCFSWYPDSLKKKIMSWAKIKHPSLIGFTKYPAYYWFSPAGLKKMAFRNGFQAFYGRCDILEENDMKSFAITVKRFASLNIILKFVLDFFVPGYSCLIKK